RRYRPATTRRGEGHIMTGFDRIAVAGAGAWGTALAMAVARAGREVTLLARNPAAAAAIAASRENPRLPGVRLDAGIAVTAEPAALTSASAILLAVPAQSVRAASGALAPHVAKGTPVITCAKGFERGTRKLMTEIIIETL